MTEPKLVYLLNIFRLSAITNIVQDLQPIIRAHYDTHIVALQPISDDAYLESELRKIDIAVHTLNCSRLNMPLAGFRLRRLLKDLGPSIVHAHAGRSAMLAPFCSPKGASVYVTYHSIAQGYSFVSRNVLRYTDRLLNGRVGVSQTVSDSWKKLGVRNITTIYNPVDFSRFQSGKSEAASIREEFGVPSGTPLLVNVGRLIHAKAQDVLVDSIKKLEQIFGGDFRLVIAGRGVLEQKLKQQVQMLGLEKRVTFAGFRNDVPALLAAADIFVFPSRWEGLPVAGLEAMASGTAIVASDVKSMQECIKDGKTGLLTPVENADALANNIKRLLEDTDFRAELANAAGEYVRDVASPSRIARQYMELYARGASKSNERVV